MWGFFLLFKPFNTEEFTYIERNYNFFWVVNSCMVFFSSVVRSQENTNLASFDSSLTPSNHLNSPVVLWMTKISRSITLFFSADVILAYNRFVTNLKINKLPFCKISSHLQYFSLSRSLGYSQVISTYTFCFDNSVLFISKFYSCFFLKHSPPPFFF